MRAPVLAMLIAAFVKITGSAPAPLAVGVLVTPGPGPNPHPTPRLTGSTNDTVTFIVKNTGTVDTRYSRTCTATGNISAITTCPTIANGGPLAAGDSVVVSLVFTAGAVGTGRVNLTVTSFSPTGASMAGGWDITIVPPTLVTPKDSLATSLPSSTNRRAIFRVKNNRPVATNYMFASICSGAAVTAPCNPGLSRTSLTIAANSSDTASIGYAVSAAVGDTGRVRFIASAMGTVPDTGSTRVVVTNAMATPVIDAVNYNPGRTIPREECVTIALGDDAAAECGDLRVVYQLPMFKILNVVRRPTLLYNSATANPVPQVAVRVTVPALTLVPDSVEAVLTIAGAVRGRQRWAGVPWDVQGKPRFIRVRDTVAPVPSTNLLNYTVEVTAIRSGSISLTATTSQPVIVVNRQSSPYGNGWWIAGLEQLFRVGTDTLVWVGGDGSAAVYSRPSGGGAWGAPSVTYPDSIRAVGSTYVRQLPDSVWVTFDAAGRQVSTRNRLGHTTTFLYDGGDRLQTLRLPSPGGLKSAYTFAYLGSAYTIADSMRFPSTKVWQTGGRIDSIIGPRAPKDSIGFRYVAGTNLISRRIDRRGAVQRFDLDGFGKVRAALLGPNGAATPDPLDSIVTTLTPAEALGFSTGGSVDSIGLHTSYDGPRRPPPAAGGALDTTAFWVNRFGAPTRIVNALRDSTRIDRGNAFPGLVTRLKSATGQILLASYDTVGRLRFVTDSSFALAKTEYRWHSKWDQLTVVLPPEKDSVVFTLDASNGNRLTQTDTRGAASQINFSYDPTTKLVNLITGPGTSFQGITYDLLGDVNIIGTQNGYQRRFIQDLFGRTVLKETQIDVGATRWLQEAFAFDNGDRDTSVITRISTPANDTQVVVRKFYDAEGNLDSLTRKYRKFETVGAPFETLTTRWVFDLAGRRVLEQQPDLQTETYRYDSASNDTSTTTRRGDRISMRYDALNRLKERIVPGYTYANRTALVTPVTNPSDTLTFRYAIPQSVDSFTYAADGQITVATNRFTRVARQYHPSGLLLADSLYIQTADTSGFGSHKYLTKYEYDTNRRRVSLIVPRLFKGPVTDTMRFSYYPWGAAYQTQDVSGLLAAYLYSPRNELAQVIYPGSLARTLLYDSDGNLSIDRVANLSPGPFPRIPNANLRWEQLTTYDARAKLMTSNDTTKFQDQVVANYADLGYLRRAIQTQQGSNTINGLVTNYSADDSTHTDALGNLTRTKTVASGNSGGNSYSNSNSRDFQYQAGTGRLIHSNAQVPGFLAGPKGYVYDLAGQLVFEDDSLGNTGAATEQRASFYSSDGRLMAVDRRTSNRRFLDEYRYDALGRRVWTRTRVSCGQLTSLECALSRVRRTVWNGVEELGEIQVPWDTLNTPASENDSSRVLFLPVGFPCGDPNPFFGRVLYTPGWAVDQPLSVARLGYNDWPGEHCGTMASRGDSTWATFTIFPHWDSRGVPTIGTFGDGAIFRPKSPWAGPCPVPYADTTSRRCVFVTWPFGYSAYDQRRGAPKMYSWHGSLLENKRDASGFDYKRNRVYDPIAGRFTQEDPIGLAGGLNAYGFASGDPVNFSDPFGLCPGVAGTNQNYFGDCPADQKFMYLMQARLAPLERTVNRIGDITGLNALGSGVDRILHGDVGGGGLEVALAVPLLPGERILVSGAKIGSSVARELGLARRELGNIVEAIKKAAGLGGRENVIITSTGNVFEKATGEFLDNVHNVFPKK